MGVDWLAANPIPLNNGGTKRLASVAFAPQLRLHSHGNENSNDG